MDLTRFPRRRYTQGWTPIDELPRLSEFLGGPRLFIKRDDKLGLAGGGNKTRKLEFLVARALDLGADTLITCGATQSNHCRLTLAAAVKEGLKCRLVLEERVEGSYDPGAGGNIFLFHLLDAEQVRVVPSGSDMAAEMEKLALEVREEGREPFIIPGGGSNPVGAAGYAACAQEIQAQSFELGIHFDYIICASGSGGTQAGLIAGVLGCTMHIPVLGMCVGRTREKQEELVYGLLRETAPHLGIDSDLLPRDAVKCFDACLGPGYSLPSPEMAEAVKLTARTEGVLLDPVYTGKAMAGLIGLVRDNYLDKKGNILFIHTGGLPALYVYREYILMN